MRNGNYKFPSPRINIIELLNNFIFYIPRKYDNKIGFFIPNRFFRNNWYMTCRHKFILFGWIGIYNKTNHVIFYSKDDHLAIVGDVLFAGSIGRTDFPRGNHADLIRSIREKLFPLGDDITFVPGHGPVSTFGEERKNNPYVGEMAN